jgi:hypothetical protein
LSSTRADDRLDKVAAAVINWNDLASSLRCLTSVADVSPKSRLILVDNGSDVDPSPAVEVDAPRVKVVRLDSNRGYAGGCNAGVAAAIAGGAEYLLLLNNDTTIDAGTLPALLRSSDRHPLSILAPKIVYADRPDIVWSAGGRVEGPLRRNEHLGEGAPASRSDAERRVDWATGCALFLSVETFLRLGPMDEAYFLYLEDVDWCLRAARLGIQTWFVPRAVIRHQVSHTLGSRQWSSHVRYYAYRNRYRLAFRNGSPVTKPIVVADALWTLAKAAIRSATSPSHRRDEYYHVRTHAVLDFFRNRWGAYTAPVPGLPTASEAAAGR